MRTGRNVNSYHGAPVRTVHNTASKNS